MKNFLKNHHKALAILKMMHQLDHSILPLCMIYEVLRTLYPYIGILLSASLIDALLSQRWKSSFVIVGIMLVLQSLCGILLDLLAHENEVRSMSIHRKCNTLICMKTIHLDYETFADKESLEQFDAADNSMGSFGGFGSFLIEYSNLFQGILSILFSLSLVITLCFYGSSHPNDLLTAITSPIVSSILFAVVIALLLFTYQRLAVYVNNHSLKLREDTIKLNQNISYFWHGIYLDKLKAKDIRLYHMEGMLLQRWKEETIKLRKSMKKIFHFQTVNDESVTLINHMTLFFAYAFVALKAFLGVISIGQFTMYVGAVQQLSEGLKGMIYANDGIRKLLSYLSYYTEYMDKDNKLNTGSLPVEKRLDHVYELEFHDVSFHYPNSEELVLSHLSLKLDLKKKLAVVGRNGAGKTTFIKLLTRLYDVSEGCITLNGIDIRKYDYDEYLSLFATVFQDFGLFEFPLGENVAASSTYDEEKVWRVLESSGVKERIEQMPYGLRTSLSQVEEYGELLSGGEMQKIAIARALYKDAPLVILDEPTASLDPISEAEIYANFHDMVEDKTSIYISHRMSSCRFCDDILVFDKGSVVQRGSHDELMKEKDQLYAKLWDAQAQYYTVSE